ncbi:MAG: flippase [Chloroflexota bacterium]
MALTEGSIEGQEDNVSQPASSHFSISTVARNVASLLASNLGVTFVGFVISWLMARYLGDELYGKYVFALSVAMLMLSVADLGLQKVATREMAKTPDQSGTLLFTAFVLRSLGYIVMGTVFLTVAPRLSEMEGLQSITILVVVIVTALGLTDVLNSVFIAHERMEFDLLTRVSERVLAVSLVATIIFMGGDLQAIAAVLAVAGAAGVLIAFFNLRRFISVQDLRFSLPTARSLLRNGAPMGLSLLVFAFYSRFDVLLLGMLRSSAEVAWFSIAYTLVLTVSTLATAGSQAFFPVFARLLYQDREQGLSLLKTTLRFGLVTSVVAGGGLFVIAYPLITIVYGAEYQPAGDALSIMAFSLVFMLPTQLMFVLLLSDNRQTWVLYINLTGALLLLFINPILISSMGVEGAALTNVMIEAFVFTLYIFLVRSTLGWVGLDTIVMPLLAGIIGFGLYVLLPFTPVVNLIAGTIAFIAALFLLKIIRRSDIVMLREMIASRGRRTRES